MGACDVVGKTDFPIAQENGLERLTTLLESMVEERRQDDLDLVVQLQDVIDRCRWLDRRPVVSWQYPNPVENQLFNWWLDLLLGRIDSLENQLRDLEQTIADAGEHLRTFVEGAGNPQALTDVARLLREGVGTLANDLADEVSLAKLATDDRWHSSAASAYATSAQRQSEDGLEALAASAESLAVFLDEHSANEVDFWDNVSDMIGEFALMAVGLYVSGIGVAASAAGLVLAIPTGGIGLIVSVAGLVVSAIGFIISAIGAWLFWQEVQALIPTTDASLTEALATMEDGALDGGQSWPVLAQ